MRRTPFLLCVLLGIFIAVSSCSLLQTNRSRGAFRKDGFDPYRTRADHASILAVENSPARVWINHLLWPIPNAKMSSLFGKRGRSFHEGVDIPAPEGTRVHAAHSGKVVYRDDGIKGYGNLIILQAKDLLTLYGHLSEFKVEKGDHVDEGQTIGLAGMSGNATGVHLHFEIRIKDNRSRNAAIDPLVFYSKVRDPNRPISPRSSVG